MATSRRAPKIEPNHAVIPAAAWKRYKAARNAREQWEEAEKLARAEIEDYAEDNEFIELEDGTVVVTWKHNKENRFNSAKFKAEHPEIYASYSELKTGRRFVPVDGAL